MMASMLSRLILICLTLSGLSLSFPASSKQTQLSRRVDTPGQSRTQRHDQAYLSAEREGAALSAQFSQGPGLVGQSYFTHFGALTRHGWTERSNIVIPESQLPEPAIVILGHPVDRSDSPTPPGSPAGSTGGQVEQLQWRKIKWSHHQHSQPVLSPSSGAHFKTPIYGATDAKYDDYYSMNSAVGAIVDGAQITPRQAHPFKTEGNTFDFNPNEAPMVPLSDWHDVAALTWQSLCEKNKQDPTKLKYLLRVNLRDPASMGVFEEIFPFWSDDTQPDVGVFKAGTSDFNAILGTSAGQDAAKLLTQHKALFGEYRRVTKIGLWRDHLQEETTVNLLFCFDDHVEVLPPDPTPESKSPKFFRSSEFWGTVKKSTWKGKGKGKGKEPQ